jgi:hypothetical protein
MIRLKDLIKEDKRASILDIDFTISDTNNGIFFEFRDKKAAIIKVRQLGSNKIVDFIQDALDTAYGKGSYFFKSGKNAEIAGGYLFGKNPNNTNLDKLKFKSVNEASDSDTYFNTATDAVEHARTQAEKKGFEIDPQDWNSEITMGGRYSRTRPGVGKTNSFSVGLLKNGKPQKKNLNISLYGMESGKFELTYYIN